jgi:DNA-binding beta-propeller fold protein YncE
MREGLTGGPRSAPAAIGGAIGGGVSTKDLVRRLLRFLGVAAAGVVVTIAGLAWDAALHARDHALAAREGVFTLTNPSHLLFLAGICLVAMGISGSIAVLTSAGRMLVRPAASGGKTPSPPQAGRPAQARSRRSGGRMRVRALMTVMALLAVSGGAAAVQAASNGQGLLPSLQLPGLPGGGGVSSGLSSNGGSGGGANGLDGILRPGPDGDLLSGVNKTIASTGPLADAVKASANDPIGQLLEPVTGLLNFKLSDAGGYWFDSGLDLFGTRSLLAGVAGVPIPINFTISEPLTHAGHTITSLIWPKGAAGMPFDQGGAFVGKTSITLKDPGLYAFQCKVHPYMLGAVVVDDPLSVGVDFGKELSLSNGMTVPSNSDIIWKLVHTFFVATVPSNWQHFSNTQDMTWSPHYPPAPILTYDASGQQVLIPNLDSFMQRYFHEPKVLPALTQRPKVPGVGEVWIDTQFEEMAGKTKPGTTTAVDTSTWTVTKKIGLPQVDMDNPHNMWTDRDQKVIYQTEWFSNKLDVIDRATGAFIRQLEVGPSPSHVMTRTDTDQLHIALNGGDSVVEIKPGATGIDRHLMSEKAGETIAHPHAHWMSGDAKKMVTPNPNTNDATFYDIPNGTITQKPKLETMPIASSMTPSGDKAYVANLLSNSISCVSMGPPACMADNGQKVAIKTIRLDANYDYVNGPKDGPYGLLPIQTPVAPSGYYMLTANTTSGTVTVVDTRTDRMVKNLACDAGCHGINFGAKKGGGYYGYLSNKFSNAMEVIDADPNLDGDLSDAAVVGKFVLDEGPGTKTDGKITNYMGLGGQGVLAVPLVYEGWVQHVPNVAPFDQLTCAQRNPIKPSACAAPASVAAPGKTGSGRTASLRRMHGAVWERSSLLSDLLK